MRNAWIVVLISACSSHGPHATVATDPASPVPPALRLPGDVRPVRIALDLAIVPEQDTARGSVAISAEVVRPTRIVWLAATDLTIASASLDGIRARVITGSDDFIGLAVDHELAVGPVAIKVDFTARIDHAKSRGIYSEREGTETYAYSFFEPIDARRAFPCFDEPRYKVPWTLTLHVKASSIALGNAPVVRETPEANGMKKVELAETKPLPSYLVAFIVGPFEIIDDGIAGRANTAIRFAVPKGRAGELGWAKQITPRVVAALEDYFAMDYPYGKLDVAVVPRYWGTMEHPGIVAMGQPLTLIRPEQETRARKQAYANILAHELGHYWFGDLVTMAWWDDTWLNEALGEWLDMITTNAVEPSWRYRDDRVAIAAAAMAADEQLSTQAIRQPVTTREAIAASFDGEITYFKGSSVFRMFEAFVGPDKWREAIRGYIRAHADGNATADDLLAAITTSLGAPVADGLRSFLDRPGVPRISAKVSCGRDPVANGVKIDLHQQRSLPAGVTDPDPKLWHVPVCLRYGTASHASRTCTLLEQASARVTDTGECPTWMILNADATGYYRSVIDPAVARDLLTPSSAVARIAQPTPAEKLMLVADLRAAVERDELPIDQLLALVPAIASDPDDKVAGSALEAASFRTDALEEPLYLASRKWLVHTFRPLALRLGWHRDKADRDERHELRRGMLPMVAPFDPALAAEAAKLADRWLADRTGLDDDMVEGVLRVAAYHGDRERFASYVKAAHGARDRTEQQRILRAIGGFHDPAVATAALDLVVGTDFDLRDSVSISQQLLGYRETRTLTLAWLRANIDKLLARMRDDEASWFLGGVAAAYCDPPDRSAAAEIIGSHAAKIDGAQALVTRGLEASQQCIANLARELPSLTRFLAP